MSQVEVVQPENEDEEVPVEVLVRLSVGVEELLNGPLERRAILLLLRDRTGLSFTAIDAILDALVDLREYYVR